MQAAAFSLEVLEQVIASMQILSASWKDPFKAAAFFAVVGPPFGALLVSVVLIPFMYLMARDGNAMGFLGFLGVAFIVPAMAPIIGVVPAALTGFIAGFFRPLLETWYGVIACGLLGATITAVLLTEVFSGHPDALELFVPCSFVGGMGAAFIFVRLTRWLRSRVHSP